LTNQPIDQKRYFHLSDEQRLNWLRLIRSQNVGPATFRDLISHYGTAAAALEALPELAQRGGAAARIKICPVEDAERELIKSESVGARFVAIGEPDYPPVLRNSDQSPPLISVMGSTDVLCQKCIAIVGSRNASIAGMKLTQRYSSELGEQGYIIVSGLARGIDTAAHRASLKSGTIAVSAGGVDHIFPDENIDLAKAIVESSKAFWFTYFCKTCK